MGKKFDSRFGQGGYAGFSDGIDGGNETASEETYFCDQYSEGKSTEHWGSRSVNS